jgi:hypothetical protein
VTHAEWLARELQVASDRLTAARARIAELEAKLAERDRQVAEWIERGHAAEIARNEAVGLLRDWQEPLVKNPLLDTLRFLARYDATHPKEPTPSAAPIGETQKPCDVCGDPNAVTAGGRSLCESCLVEESPIPSGRGYPEKGEG